MAHHAGCALFPAELHKGDQGEFQYVVPGHDQHVFCDPLGRELDVLHRTKAILVAGRSVVEDADMRLVRGPVPKDGGKFMVGHDREFFDLVLQFFHQPVQDRLPGHLQKRLRKILCQWIQSRGISSR